MTKNSGGTRREEMLRETERTEQGLLETLGRVRRIRSLLPCFEGEFAEEELAEIEKNADLIRREAARIYSDFGADCFYGGAGRDPDEECGFEGAEGFICSRGICFSCGMLPVNLFRGTFENIRIRKDIYSASVGRTAEKILASAPENDAEFERKYREKTINFLFVYGPGDGNSVPDSDNHYTRKVSNEIAFFLPCGDEGRSTDFRYSTAVCAEIPPGTYITVTPGKASVISDSEVIGIWAEHMKTQ